MRRTGAVDYGRRRIGLAVCDPLGITVRGLPTLRLERAGDLAEAAARTAEALRAEEVERVVVGLPLHVDGRESDMSAEVRAFAALLEEDLGVALHFRDEGLTTWEARERVAAAGIPAAEAKRSGALDREVACGLLRAWLRDVQQ